MQKLLVCGVAVAAFMGAIGPTIASDRDPIVGGASAASPPAYGYAGYGYGPGYYAYPGYSAGYSGYAYDYAPAPGGAYLQTCTYVGGPKTGNWTCFR